MSDHKTEALRLVDCAIEAPNGALHSTMDMMAAQVHATLYLAEQQRIANMLHAHELGSNEGMAMARLGAVTDWWAVTE